MGKNDIKYFIVVVVVFTLDRFLTRLALLRRDQF